MYGTGCEIPHLFRFRMKRRRKENGHEVHIRYNSSAYRGADAASREPDWKCASCGYSNWASNSSCRRCAHAQCSTTRSSVGTAAPGTGKGKGKGKGSSSAVASGPEGTERKLVASLEAQLRAVEAVVAISDGELLDCQRRIRDGLKQRLEAARLAARGSLPITVRRSQVQLSLDTVQGKLEANRQLLLAAEARVVELKGYCASQAEKEAKLLAEMHELTSQELQISRD